MLLDPVQECEVLMSSKVQEMAIVEMSPADPHTRHREMVVELDGYRGVASPIKMGRTPASYRLPPPKRGG